MVSSSDRGPGARREGREEVFDQAVGDFPVERLFRPVPFSLTPTFVVKGSDSVETRLSLHYGSPARPCVAKEDRSREGRRQTSLVPPLPPPPTIAPPPPLLLLFPSGEFPDSYPRRCSSAGCWRNEFRDVSFLPRDLQTQA